jgi:hypothetical protein
LTLFYLYSPCQNYQLFQAIKTGAGFFFFDIDYLKHPDIGVKIETPCAETEPSGVVRDSSSMEPSSFRLSALSSSVPTRKRFHRSAAATVKSSAFAQSDPDDGNPTTSDPCWGIRTVETNLRLWTKHLSALQKDETKKVFAHVPFVKQSTLKLFPPSSTRRNVISSSLIFLVQNLTPSRYVMTLYMFVLPLNTPRPRVTSRGRLPRGS